MVTVPYTTEQARIDVATLRGQIDLINEALTQADGGVVPNQPASGLMTQYVAAGHKKYISGNDGNAYNTGEFRTQVSPHNQAVTSTTAVTISNLSAPVSAGTYLLEMHLVMNWGATAGTCLARFTGPTISEFDIQCLSRQTATVNLWANGANYQFAGTSNGGGYNSGNFQLSTTMSSTVPIFIIDIWCEFTFTAAGTLNFQCAQGTSGDQFTINYGYMVLKPIT